MKQKPRWRVLVLLTLGTVFILSLFQAGSIIFRARKEEAAFAALVEEVERNKEKQTEATSSSETKPEEIPSSYASLKEKNPDFFGWLSIPDTELNYPVMYTPDEPEYYLHRAFDKSSSQSGVPFVGQGYRENGNHTIIYGHNMKNGTMFATLLSYQDKDFWREHSVITLETLNGSKEYQVLGAFYSKVYPQAEADVFRFYQCSDLEEQEAFEEYAEKVQNAALYDTGINAEYGGELLTLSTCSYTEKDGRFVVVAYSKETQKQL